VPKKRPFHYQNRNPPPKTHPHSNQWDQSHPGFLETDTVAHCGESFCGTFAYTIDCVDIATGWTEQRAARGKGETDVLKQIKDIETSLPFPLLGFDWDNGYEFLNYHLIRHFTHRKQIQREKLVEWEKKKHLKQESKKEYTFSELLDWYLDHPRAKRKKTYLRDIEMSVILKE